MRRIIKACVDACKGKLYNVLFPMWMLILFPTTWLIILPGNFLIDSMAVIVNSVAEVWEFFEEEGLDTDGMTEDDIIETPEVFALEDGRYLIVQA